MITELAHACFLLATALSLASGFLLFSEHRVSDRASWAVCVLLFFSLTGLIVAFIRSDFSVGLVIQHSHSAKPLFFKIAGAWGNHEGSLLLWMFFLSLAAALHSRLFALPDPLRHRSCSMLLLLIGQFGVIIAFTSNPFTRVAPVLEGLGLNPLLQDVALAIHPPLLYLGYSGIAVCFCLVLAVLLGRDNWQPAIRPLRILALFSWSLLSLGIALGSWWAYRELGWGGFWFWDPVEAISLLPWLLLTALIHTLRAHSAKPMMTSWLLLLTISAFLATLAGTLLVRSGLLTSVHSFAENPDRGLALLVLCILNTSAAFLLLIRYQRQPHPPLAVISKESFIALNNILLAVIAISVAAAIIYPIAVSLLGQPQLSVGSRYYALTIVPIALVLALACGLGQRLPWVFDRPVPLRSRLFRRLFRQYAISGLLSLGLVALVLWSGKAVNITPILVGSWLIGAWLIFSSVHSLGRQTGQWGMAIAHLGFGLLVVSSATASLSSTELLVRLQPDQTIAFDDGKLKLKTIEHLPALDGQRNFETLRIIFTITYPDAKEPISLAPERRRYVHDGSQTTEAAVVTGAAKDIYAVIADLDQNKGIAIRVLTIPLVFWLWLSAGLIVVGGLIAMVRTCISPSGRIN